MCGGGGGVVGGEVKPLLRNQEENAVDTNWGQPLYSDIVFRISKFSLLILKCKFQF